MEPMTIAALYLAGKGVAGLGKMYGAYKTKKTSEAALGELTGSYLQKSPEEQQFLAMLRGRVEKGALPVKAMMSDVSADIGEHGQVARQKQLGFAASRGLENTGVAASMAGKADANTIQAIARQARAIAIQNEMTKTDAQRELGQYGTGRSDLVRQLSRMKYGAEVDTTGQYYGQMAEGVGDIGEGISGFAGMQAGQQSGWQQRPDGSWYWVE